MLSPTQEHELDEEEAEAEAQTLASDVSSALSSSQAQSRSRSASPVSPAGSELTPEEEEPSGSELTVQVHPPPESPSTPNPPTPNQRDIHLQAFGSNSNQSSRRGTPDNALGPAQFSRREPPAYSPLDAYTYSEGVHIDLPAEVIAAALEGGTLPSSVIGQTNNSYAERRRSRRR